MKATSQKAPPLNGMRFILFCLVQAVLLQALSQNLIIQPAVEVKFESVSGVQYRIERSDGLGDWTPLEETLTGTGSTLSRFLPADRSAKFYRLAPGTNINSSAVSPAPEVESNDSGITAQPISIGRLTPIEASIGKQNDVDWYRIEVDAGKTYVIELFDVAASLAKSNGRDATIAFGGGLDLYGTGLALSLHDANGTLLDKSKQNGNGDVHCSLTFEAGKSTTYLIAVECFSEALVGNYSIRVLPPFSDARASWDAATFEPNGTPLTAYLLPIGVNASLQAQIGHRTLGYSTVAGDVDCYRIEVEAGKTYTVELFDVAANLAKSSGGDATTAFSDTAGRFDSGLALSLHDANGTVLGKAKRNGNGNVHTSLTFEAGATTVYFIAVECFSDALSGGYSIRVLPPYSHTRASWDATTYEPNGTPLTAYLLPVGNGASLRAQIERRNIGYSTVAGDVDWYRIEVEAGKAYTAELFDVSASLAMATGSEASTGYLNGAGRFGTGMALSLHDDSGTRIAAGTAVAGQSVHFSLQFTAGLTGSLFLVVECYSDNADGAYSLRVK